VTWVVVVKGAVNRSRSYHFNAGVTPHFGWTSTGRDWNQ